MVVTEAPPGRRRWRAGFESIVDAIGDTPLVRLQTLSPNPEVTIWVKLEGENPSGSVKDRIARAMLDAARTTGRWRRVRRFWSPHRAIPAWRLP